MKKLYTLSFILLASLSFGQTFYSENMGTPTATTSIANYLTGTAPATFQKSSPISYTGNGDVRSSTVSNYPGASGGGNVWFSTTTPIHFFQIEGIDTSSYNSADLELKFGYLTSNITNHLNVEQSSDGTNWSPISYTKNTVTSWTLVTVTGGVLSTSNLRLRFTQSLLTVSHRLDDISLTKVSASCTLALGAPVAVCDASTLAIDTYTVTIPYTGGGNSTYTVTPNFGTVGGDNPTSIAAGNITVSGVPEGTNFSSTVTGGTCNLSAIANSPECKTTNSMPVSEPFNYTAGTTLNTSQNWTNVSASSDEITTISGNLTYTGITSSGNSVSFAGAGSDTKLPFTEITSGKLFSSFLVSVTSLTGISTSSQTYFATLSDLTNAFTVARIYLKTDGTQYQYGICKTTTVADIVWSPNLYAIGSTQYLVFSYDFTDNKLALIENPTIGGSANAAVTVTPTTALTSIANFVLRQDSATSTPAMTIDELTITTTPNFTLSVKQNSIVGLKIYPNPVTDGILKITSDSSNAKTVAVYDILGKQVLNSKTSNNAVNVSNLKGGAYIIKITEDGKTDTRKLIIQ
jgi:hypothetical protein